MNTRLRTWAPIALCCLPGIIVATIAGIALAAGSTAFGLTSLGWPGAGLVVLAVLACPISMGLMMRHHRHSSPGSAHPMGSCCPPNEKDSTVRLATLRNRRVALERELAAMQAVPDPTGMAVMPITKEKYHDGA